MTVNARGGGARNVTAGKHDFEPSFSPDGRRIAFIRQVGSQRRLYVVNRTGSGLRRLPTAPANRRAGLVAGRQAARVPRFTRAAARRSG
jgi:Tol biopolymer transport system component